MKYTLERNHQIVIELLKYHGIKKIIASPGGTNVTFVASVQRDSYFDVYSSVDERSAAYMACGMAAESGEVVVLSCTGATASRNYYPGLTEAYYRNLPILAITSSMPAEWIGHNSPQVTDRTCIANDIAKMSVHIPNIKDEEDEWNCTVKANQAILELKHHTCGPVHINLETSWASFDESEVKPVHYIDRIVEKDSFPEIRKKRVAVFVGTHKRWDEKLTQAVDSFCEKHNAIVIGDHTSNYKGKYLLNSSLLATQINYHSLCTDIELLIHIGDISGAYLSIFPKEVWRVNVDGKICDTFKKLRYVFEMEEVVFFEKYNEMSERFEMEYYDEWKSEDTRLRNMIPNELPFSNVYVAREFSTRLPEKSVLHLGILNSLRSWNLFNIDKSIVVYSNTGGFGIDGCVSSLIGASIASPEKLFFGVVGDLAFFYDMNSLGNRHISANIRLVVINNGIGQEFKNFGNGTAQFGDETNPFIAAEGHYGRKSKALVKGYAEALGFKYMVASDPDTFCEHIEEFCSREIGAQPMLFEVFTNTTDETDALKIIRQLNQPELSGVKRFIKDAVGEKRIQAVKKILRG